VSEHLFSVLHEGLRQGTSGDLLGQRRVVRFVGGRSAGHPLPVHLWYGEHQMVPPVNGEGLRDHTPDATLVVYGGEGHLVTVGHWEEMVKTLTEW